jgi:predicted dehydrogenase
MNLVKKVKLGVVGLGNMGSGHLNYLKKLATVELVGVCDIVKEKADKWASQCNCTAYYSYLELLDKSGLEAILIAVPHYDHTQISIDAFNRGIHVMCEKPLAVHVNDAQKIIAAYEKAKAIKPNIVFGIMFMERTYSHYMKIKDIIETGELGRLTRATWINTAWFRSQAYYDSGDWRASWAGEGGGVLTNQCPHNLDMYQWLFGVPTSVSGHAHLGKYHDIEVEDEVTAYFEHDNGMIGHFIVSTAETPGTNRLEVIGENGKLVYENGKLIFYRNRMSMFKFSKETKEGFGNVESWYTEIPVSAPQTEPHKAVTEKFINVIVSGGGELVGHGLEGIKSVTLANAIMLSSFTKREVEIPFDGDIYENKLKELIKTSRYIKKVNTEIDTDFSKSFSKS